MLGLRTGLAGTSENVIPNQEPVVEERVLRDRYRGIDDRWARSVKQKGRPKPPK
jgi:hypothetical protein